MSTAHTHIPRTPTSCLGVFVSSRPKKTKDKASTENAGAQQHDNLAEKPRQKTYNSTILLENRTPNMTIFGWRYQKPTVPPQLTFNRLETCH
jgi:hypothetical protein